VVALSGLVFNALLGVAILAAFNLLPNLNTFAHQANICVNSRLFGGELQGCVQSVPGWALRIEQFFFIFALTNIAIAILNIIPLHPLDGYHVLFALLPTRQAIGWRNFAQWGELLLLVIFFVVPVILQFLNISFSPANLFIVGPADTIAVRLLPVPANLFVLM